MGKYKLLAKRGGHVERTDDDEVVTYKAGDVVESKRNLAKLFPNKFKRVSRDEIRDDVEQPVIPDPTETAKSTAAK